MRSRSIKPGFFQNENLIELPFEYRLLFAGLWCMADREGRLEDRPKKIKLSIFPGDNVDCDVGLQALHDKGFILRYQIENVRYIQVLAWKKHQHPHVKEGASTIPAPCEHSAISVQVPDKTDANTSLARLTPSSLTPDSGFLTPDSSSLRSPRPHGERAKRPRKVADEPPEFAEVRSCYPRRAGGQRWGDALKFWRRRLEEGEKPETILAGIKRYATFARATGIERTQHVQQAATFLGDNRGYLELWHAPPAAESNYDRFMRNLNSSSDSSHVIDHDPGFPAISRD